MTVKVFLVTGRSLIRLGVSAMLDQHPGIELLGTAASEADALEQLRSIQPDVVLMDIQLAGTSVLKLMLRIKEKYQAVKVLILPIQESDNLLINLLEAGADGYLLNSVSQEELVVAIDRLKNEGTYIKPGFILKVLEKYKESAEYTGRPTFNISDREMEVLNLVAEGHTNIDMAKKLFTSVRTIEARRKRLLDKTGTLNTATLIRFAVLNGLIK